MTKRTLLAAFAMWASVITLDAWQQDAAVQPTTFEAASIRPNKSGESGSTFRRQPGGRFNAINVTVRQLITNAYQIQGVQLVGAPDWTNDERFDIVAKIEGNPPPMPPGSPNDPMILAVRALIEDRFTLRTHREKREMDVYALVMARPDRKPGPNLRPTTQDCESLMREAARTGVPPTPPPGGPSVVCGIRGSFGRVEAGGASIAQLVNGLAGQVGRIVVDRTGLQGGWDFEMYFAQESRGPLPPGVELPPVDPNAPSLFTALPEQLGLRLEAAKAPVDVLVVDSVARPTSD
jgi:uncharacterized protein (TIGR03435 family)